MYPVRLKTRRTTVCGGTITLRRNKRTRGLGEGAANKRPNPIPGGHRYDERHVDLTSDLPAGTSY